MYPPSSTIVWPLIISDFCVHKNNTRFAISTVFTERPTGFCFLEFNISSLLGKLLRASVSTIPADIALTLIFLSANSTAKYLVIASNDALEVPTRK